jgi:hypothetical protein
VPSATEARRHCKAPTAALIPKKPLRVPGIKFQAAAPGKLEESVVRSHRGSNAFHSFTKPTSTRLHIWPSLRQRKNDLGCAYEN